MPHIMKNRYLIFALVAFAIVACNTETVISPSAKFSTSHYRTYTVPNVLGQDSLVRDTITFGDTVFVGDTVRVPIQCNGYYDYLRSITASTDTSKMRVSLMWDEEYNSYLADDADPAHGRLTFVADKVYACNTTIIYVPKASGTHRIDLLLLSAAKEGYSEGAWHFNVPVK